MRSEANKVIAQIDRSRVEEMVRVFESFSDYERRILYAYLGEMNRGARQLPVGTLIAMGIGEEKKKRPYRRHAWHNIQAQ